MLEDQARENFYALKAREHTAHFGNAPAPTPAIAQSREQPQSTTGLHLNPFGAAANASPSPAPASKPLFAAKPTTPPKPVAMAKPKPTPKPVAAAKPAPVSKPIAAKPAPKPSRPIASNSVFARWEKPKRSDETLYLYDMPHGPEPDSARYRAYKIQYAHELAKLPQDLTPEEREWVRRHYREH